MRNVVKDLSQHDIYNSKYCDFSNKHFAYEDSAAKILKSVFEGGATSIGAQQMSKFYEDHKTIQITDAQPKAVKTVFNFLVKSFKNSPSPHFKMYALMDVATVVNSMLNTYDLSKYPKEFAQVYLSFLDLRTTDNEKEEEDRDPKLIAYASAARTDGLDQMMYRQNLIKEYFLDNMTCLALKDNNRNFTPDQRAAIYRKDKGKCQLCGKSVSEDEFEADHIVLWSHGGPTQIANGQVLCVSCNRSKKFNARYKRLISN